MAGQQVILYADETKLIPAYSGLWPISNYDICSHDWAFLSLFVSLQLEELRRSFIHRFALGCVKP